MLTWKDYSTYDSEGFYKTIIRLQKDSKIVNLHSQRIFDLKRVILFLHVHIFCGLQKSLRTNLSTAYKGFRIVNAKLV